MYPIPNPLIHIFWEPSSTSEFHNLTYSSRYYTKVLRLSNFNWQLPNHYTSNSDLESDGIWGFPPPLPFDNNHSKKRKTRNLTLDLTKYLWLIQTTHRVFCIVKIMYQGCEHLRFPCCKVAQRHCESLQQANRGSVPASFNQHRLHQRL